MSTIDIASVRELMIQQIQLLQDLLVTLNDEYTLLEQKQLDRLTAITGAKSSLLDQLRHLELAQYEQLKAFSENPAEQITSLKRLITEHAHADKDTFLNLLNNLDTLATACSDRNRINGMLIHSRRKVNHEILSMLKNNSTESSAVTYSRHGATSSIPYNATNLKV